MDMSSSAIPVVCGVCHNNYIIWVLFFFWEVIPIFGFLWIFISLSLNFPRSLIVFSFVERLTWAFNLGTHFWISLIHTISKPEVKTKFKSNAKIPIFDRETLPQSESSANSRVRLSKFQSKNTKKKKTKKTKRQSWRVFDKKNPRLERGDETVKRMKIN